MPLLSTYEMYALKIGRSEKKKLPDASARLEGSRPKRRLSPSIQRKRAGKKKANKYIHIYASVES